MNDNDIVTAVGSSSSSPPSDQATDGAEVDIFQSETMSEVESGGLLGTDDIAIVADAISQTNLLIVICIAVILACGFARALLGWCHRG